MSQNISTASRQRGTLIGLAVGDALGAAVEFRSPGNFEPVVDYRSGGPHGLESGEWTDDTSMALALADSMANVGWDLNDQARRYLDWRDRGLYSVNGRCFDIGTTVDAALQRFRQTGDARSAGSTDEWSSGNGSIMRLAPVPIRYTKLFPDKIERLSRLAAESSLTTHGSPQCVSACRYLALILCGLIHGEDRDTILDADWPPLAELRRHAALHPEVEEIAEGSFRRKQPPEIVGSGYVVKSLEASLWAFHKATTFRDAVLEAVNLGDDADTTGAVCGQIAGAYWGKQGVPQDWRNRLARRELIEEALVALMT